MPGEGTLGAPYDRMSNSAHPWSLKGITAAARAAAKQAAEVEGVTLGTWLTQVIRDVAADQGVTEADIAVQPPPRPAVVEPPLQVPSRPSSIERLMHRNGSAPVQTAE